MRRSPRRVLWVTMAFPAPSEAFAGVEVRALRRLGVEVRIAALRTRHRMTDVLIRDWGLDDTALTHWSWRTLPGALAFGARHPWMTVEVVAWLIHKGWRRPGSLMRALLLLPRCLEIFGACLRERPDVVHLFWGHFPATIGHMALRWMPQTHVSTALGAYDLLLEYGPGLDVARHAHSVWTQAMCNREPLSNAGVPVTRLHVLMRGVDTAQVGDAPVKEREAPVVVVARLEANKGVDDALRAFARGAEGHPNVRLLVAGEGPQAEQLRMLAAGLGIGRRVEFVGAVSHSRVFELLRRAGTFLLLSRNPSERLPNALKEAMACRCICIVTRTPGLDELSAAWSRPLVVEQGDWNAAASLLRAVLDSPDSLESDRDAGRAFVIDRLDAREVARRRIAVWVTPGEPPCAA